MVYTYGVTLNINTHIIYARSPILHCIARLFTTNSVLQEESIHYSQRNFVYKTVRAYFYALSLHLHGVERMSKEQSIFSL